MFITTANILQDNKIVQTFEPINATVVIGVNVFGDFFSSFTDFFGGRSNAYESRMNEMFEYAKINLKSQITKLKADGLIGFSVDYNEISAKDKGMLMISLYGTPVTVEKQKDLENTIDQIDFQSFKNKIRAKKIIKSYDFTGEKFVISKSDLDFIVNSKLPELADFVFQMNQHIQVNVTQNGIIVDVDPEAFLKYYENLDTDVAKKILYGTLKKEHRSSNVMKKYLQQIINLKLIDYELLANLINIEDHKSSLPYFELAIHEPHFLRKSDIAFLQEIQALYKNIQELLQPAVVIEKSLLVKNEKWICNFCSNKNDFHYQVCSQCQRYMGGFLIKAYNPQQISDELEIRIQVLEEIFNNR